MECAQPEWIWGKSHFSVPKIAVNNINIVVADIVLCVVKKSCTSGNGRKFESNGILTIQCSVFSVHM